MEVLFSCLQFNHELFQFIPARSNGLINSHTLQCTILPFPPLYTMHCQPGQAILHGSDGFHEPRAQASMWGDEMELHAWNHCMGNYYIPSQLRRFKFSFFVVGEGITQPSLCSHFHNSDNDTLTPENYLIKLIKLPINLIVLLFVGSTPPPIKELQWLH